MLSMFGLVLAVDIVEDNAIRRIFDRDIFNRDILQPQVVTAVFGLHDQRRE